MITESVRRHVATAALIVLVAAGVDDAQTPGLTPSTLVVRRVLSHSVTRVVTEGAATREGQLRRRPGRQLKSHRSS